MRLTPLERKIFKVLWAQGNKASVQSILDHWEEQNKPLYTTVLKTLQILEQKDLVTHEKSGRSYNYIAKVSKDTALNSNTRELMDLFFDGSPVAFAQTFISRQEFSPGDIQELKKLIEEKEKELHDNDSKPA